MSLRRHFAGKPAVASRNVGCFLKALDGFVTFILERVLVYQVHVTVVDSLCVHVTGFPYAFSIIASVEDFLRVRFLTSLFFCRHFVRTSCLINIRVSC